MSKRGYYYNKLTSLGESISLFFSLYDNRVIVLIWWSVIMCLLKKIEKKRTELLNIAKKKGVASSETLRCSKELDELITKYQRQKMR